MDDSEQDDEHELSSEDDEMSVDVDFASSFLNKTETEKGNSPSKRAHQEHEASHSEPKLKQRKLDAKRKISEIQSDLFADHYLEIELALQTIESIGKNEKSDIRNNIVKKIILLLNSGGGVLSVRNLDFQKENYVRYLDPFNKFMKYVYEQIDLDDQRVQDVFHHRDIDGGKYMLIYIEGSSYLHTSDFKSYDSYDAGINTTNRKKVLKFLKGPTDKSTKNERKLKLRLENRIYRYNEKVHDKMESYEFQLKSCTQMKDCSTLLKMFHKKEKLANYVTAFTKNQEGGSIAFGISEEPDKKNKHRVPTVKGICIPLGKKIQKKVKDAIYEEITSHMKWLKYDGNILTEDEIQNYVSVVFYDVEDCPSNESDIKVMEVVIAHFNGLVFSSINGPEALRLNEVSCKEEKIPIDEWYKYMTKGMHELDFHVNQRFQMIPISQSTPTSSEIGEIKGSLYGIQKDVFKREVGLNMVPAALVERLQESSEKMKLAIQCMKKEYSGQNSVAVFVEIFLSSLNNERSLKNLKSCTKPSLCSVCNYTCDVCIFSRYPPVFLTIADINPLHTDCYNQCKEYCHQTARRTKLILSSFTSTSFRLRFGVLNLQKKLLAQFTAIHAQKKFFPDELQDVSRSDISQILSALSLAASLIPSALYSHVGTSFLNILTTQQLHFMWKKFDKRKRFLIKGIPGSGKTELAKTVLRKLKKQGFKKEEILYLTEHVPISHQIRKLNLCLCLTRKGFHEKIEQDEDCLDHSDIKHIIVDDSQFMDNELESHNKMVHFDWYRILKEFWEGKPKSQKGKFIILYGEHRYKFLSSRPKFLDDDIEEEELTVIVRNSRNIAEFAKRYSRSKSYKTAVKKIKHNFSGDNVREVIYDLSLPSAKLRAIDQEVYNCFNRGFSKGDIAVLLQKETVIPKELKCEETTKFLGQLECIVQTNTSVVTLNKCGKLNICKATDNDLKDHVVIDTVRRYSSLDRPCVILIDASVASYDDTTDPDGIAFVALTRPIAYLVIVKRKRGDTVFTK